MTELSTCAYLISTTIWREDSDGEIEWPMASRCQRMGGREWVSEAAGERSPSSQFRATKTTTSCKRLGGGSFDRHSQAKDAILEREWMRYSSRRVGEDDKRGRGVVSFLILWILICICCGTNVHVVNDFIFICGEKVSWTLNIDWSSVLSFQSFDSHSLTMQSCY